MGPNGLKSSQLSTNNERNQMLVPGKYRASAMSAKIVENSKTGSISFVTTVRLDDVEGTPEMDNWTCLVQTDGTPSQISYDSLRKAFPFWDGMDPIALADTVTANPGAYQVEAALDSPGRDGS